MEILILGYCCASENERDGRVSYLLFRISVALTDCLHHNVLGERGGACSAACLGLRLGDVRMGVGWGSSAEPPSSSVSDV